MSTIDQQFIEYIVKSLVGKPDAVKVDRRIDERGVLLELTVDPEDLGRVIGKRGSTAQSLRTLLRALGTKNDARYNLKIVDNGEPPPRRDDSTASSIDDRPAKTKKDDTKPAKDDSSDDPKPSTAADAIDMTEDEELPEAANDSSSEASAKEEETNHSDLASRTRKELEDLDDLDV